MNAANPKGCLRYAALKSSFYLGVSGWVDLSYVLNQLCYLQRNNVILESCEVAKACVKSNRFKWKIGLRSRSRSNFLLYPLILLLFYLDFKM